VLISEEYKALNIELHNKKNLFGNKGYKRADQVYEELIKPYEVRSLLDYGSGKGSLVSTLLGKYKVLGVNYDPCVDKFSVRPIGQFDGVVCSGVLEHIEPECLDEVLKDIYFFGHYVFYLSIALVKSNKSLPDGRNAHLIIENSDFWRKKLDATGFILIKELENEKTSNDPNLIFLTGIYKRTVNDNL